MDKEGFTILGTKGVLEWFARNNKEFKLIEKSPCFEQVIVADFDDIKKAGIAPGLKILRK